MGVEIEISEEMVQQVLEDFERDNPGRTADTMDGEEFTERMMKKIRSSARIVPAAALAKDPQS